MNVSCKTEYLSWSELNKRCYIHSVNKMLRREINLQWNRKKEKTQELSKRERERERAQT